MAGPSTTSDNALIALYPVFLLYPDDPGDWKAGGRN